MFKKIFPSVRIRQFISNPLYIFFWLKRFTFYKKQSFVYVDKYKDFKQLNENETLKYIIDNNKSIVRFGDGEFGLLTGAGIYCGIKSGFLKFNWCQKYSRKIKYELIRILKNQNNEILVSFPPIWQIIHNDIENGIVFSNKEIIHSSMHVEARMMLWKFINKSQIYGSWSVFMPQHNSLLDWKLIYEYIKNKTIIIVTGGTGSLSNVSLGKKTLYVECGKYNAFERRFKIFESIRYIIKEESLEREDCLFLTSLGPTASIVVEFISNQGFVAWDTGHLFQFAEKEIEKMK